METFSSIGISLIQQLLLLGAIAICLILGAVMGWSSGTMRSKDKINAVSAVLQKTEEGNEALKNRGEMLSSDLQMSLAEIERLSGERSAFEERSTQMEERLKDLRGGEGSKLAEQIQMLVDNAKKAQSAATPAVDGNLDGFMGQISEQVAEFKTQLQQITQERTQQQSSVEQMLVNLSEAANELGAARHGADKGAIVLEGAGISQSDWSSSILERLFAMSGLNEASLCERLPGKNGGQPTEWAVHLPDNKALIIDGDCSMENWHRFINLPEGEAKDKAGEAFVGDVKERLNLLKQRDFTEHANIGDVEFSFIFIPPDAGWMYLLNKEPEFVYEAQKERITLVSSSNLLLSLKLVEHLWTVERENQNSERIVDRAHRLYKKWLAFAQEMHRLGGSLQKAGSEYQKAMQRLSTGRGNLVRQTEELIELGVPRPPGKLPESVASGMLSRQLGDDDEELDPQAQDEQTGEQLEAVAREKKDGTTAQSVNS